MLQYPRRYHLEQEVPLVPQDPRGLYTCLQLQHLGHLLSLVSGPIRLMLSGSSSPTPTLLQGLVPWLNLPYPNAPPPPGAGAVAQSPPPDRPPPLPQGLVPWLKLPYPNALVQFASDPAKYLSSHPPEKEPTPRHPSPPQPRDGEAFLSKTQGSIADCWS